MSIDAVGMQWASKAVALDRYRWLLLRERHGWLGSALRFLREALGDTLFGLLARFRLASRTGSQPCDFLLLQSAPKVIAFQRKKLLIEALRSRGYVLIETALPEAPSILRERLLRRPPQPVPLRYFGYAAHAEWLVEHYTPKIVLNDRNGSLYSPFLRLALNARQALLVHLAHATTVESSRRLGMNDYDYYFLFGQSSLDALQARELRFGSSTALLAGSHMIDTAFDLPAADPARRVLLVLGVGPDKEKEAGYQRTYRLLRDWAARNPDYQVLVKAHPRSQVPFWQHEASVLDNIEVLPRECGLAEALARASVVVNIMSNAVIEAALARRPLLYVNASDDADIFAQERFLGPCVATLESLQEAVSSIEQDHAAALARSAAFAEFHLAHGCAGLAWNIQALTSLLEGRCPSGVSVALTSTVEQ
ncbi:capsule biosynthesis protein [Pseudomonas sp. L-22-4S-12]|uniref:capsule biosynthesis protein n=1 Tax=Pseudomonas sp. L-22-4S-12 TaxID=2610893 RepID=UPI00132C2ED2|nr:capsule biosynthesis protein [Pseudomonas sp. L-22-4S-12]MWV15369.1 capsule biosynthesis protein [Pseudomonas sp. L-22-4S-12]